MTNEQVEELLQAAREVAKAPQVKYVGVLLLMIADLQLVLEYRPNEDQYRIYSELNSISQRSNKPLHGAAMVEHQMRFYLMGQNFPGTLQAAGAAGTLPMPQFIKAFGPKIKK